MTQLQLATDSRDGLYFGKYRYKLSIRINSIERMRYHKSYSEYLNRPSYWRAPAPALPNVTEIDRYFNWRNTVNSTTGCMVRLEGGKLMVYSNDLTYLQQTAAQIDVWHDVKLTEVECPTEPNVIQFVNPPKYNYRVYFRAKMVKEDFRDLIKGFIDDQKTNGAQISVNGAMSLWLRKKWHTSPGTYYLRDSYYIDYSDEAFGTVLMLMFGEQLNPKVYKLVQRPA